MPIRHFHLLRAYAEIASVQLVYFYRTQAELQAAEILGKYCDSVHPVSIATTDGEKSLARLPRWRRRLRLASAGTPLAMTLHFSAEMARLVETLAASADLVHVATLHMAVQVNRLLRRPKRPPLVLELPDLDTTLQTRWLRTHIGASWPRLGFGVWELARISAFQKRAVRAFDRVLVCSETERRALGTDNIVVVPNGTTVPADLPRSESDGRTILFCGLLSYPPNIDAVEFFVRDVLPEIRKAVPDAKVLVVGRTPPARIRALADGAAIRVEADVTDVADYYRRATMAVVPLRSGGGTRLKIPEAWALGVPVVSTPLGYEGLEARAGEHLVSAEGAAELAGACVEMLRNPALRARLIERGRSLAWRKYRWEVIGARVKRMAAELVERPPARDAEPSRGRKAVGTWPR